MKKGGVPQTVQASEQAIRKAEKRKSTTCATAAGRRSGMAWTEVAASHTRWRSDTTRLKSLNSAWSSRRVLLSK